MTTESPLHPLKDNVILYLHGFASGPDSTKATTLARRFEAMGVPFHRADLTPGPDGFERSTPLTMLAEAERLVELHRPNVLIGSSLGGYLAALVAARQAARDVPPEAPIARLVLLVPAFGFVQRWRGGIRPEDERRWRAEGCPIFHHATQTERRLSWAFMEDAERLPPYPEVRIPALCFAGARDQTVPPADVARFVDRTPSARLIVLDDDHALLASLDRIFDEARAFLSPVIAAPR